MSYSCKIMPNKDNYETCQVKGHQTGASNCSQRPSNKNIFYQKKVKSNNKINFEPAYPELTESIQPELNDKPKNADNINTTDSEVSSTTISVNLINKTMA